MPKWRAKNKYARGKARGGKGGPSKPPPPPPPKSESDSDDYEDDYEDDDDYDDEDDDDIDMSNVNPGLIAALMGSMGGFEDAPPNMAEMIHFMMMHQFGFGGDDDDEDDDDDEEEYSEEEEEDSDEEPKVVEIFDEPAPPVKVEQKKAESSSVPKNTTSNSAPAPDNSLKRLLNKAIEDRNEVEVLRIIAQGVDVNTPHDGFSPLSLACKSEQLSLVDALLQYGAVPDVQSMELAVLARNTEIIQKLIDRKADVNRCCHSGKSPLMTACEKGFLGVATFLVEQGADVNKKDSSGETALMKACDQRKTEIINFLLHNGADPKFVSRDGESAVSVAFKRGDLSTTMILVEAGAPPTLHESLLSSVIQRDHPKRVDVFLYLLSQGAKFSRSAIDRTELFARACHDGHIELVTKLIQMGANPGVPYTAFNGMSWAVVKQDKQMLKKLLELGVSPNLWDRDRASPLIMAANTDNLEIAELLLQHGANPGDRTSDNRSPFSESKSSAMHALLLRYVSKQTA